MRGTGRNTAHKIHTQPLRSTQGMFSAHFTICAGARRGDPSPLILQVRVGEKTKSGGGNWAGATPYRGSGEVGQFLSR